MAKRPAIIAPAIFIYGRLRLQIVATAGSAYPEIDAGGGGEHAHDDEDPTDSLDQPFTHGRNEDQAQYDYKAPTADPGTRSCAAHPELHRL